MIHHTPIKYFILQIYRIVKVKPMLRNAISFQNTINPAEVVSNLKAHGFSIGSTVNYETVNRILENYPNAKAAVYDNAHLNDKALYNLVTCDYFIDVAYQYLGFEPKLHSCKIIVDIPGSQKTTQDIENYFHYDIAGIKSLNAFIYLTNVCKESMPHIAIRGSHRNKRFRHIISGKLSFAEAEKFYPNKITCLTGKSGTVYFENTEIFHRKGSPSSKDRIMINVLYTHHLSPLA